MRVNDTLPQLILKNLEDEGQNIRSAYQRRLPSNPSKDYYFMLRNTGNTEAMIVEYGFLDSKKDDVTQLKSNWKNYAEAVVKAIAEYTGLPYNQTNPDTYIVKSGDSLWSIAKKYGISASELKRINNLDSNLLKIGQELFVVPKNEGLYVVQPGDTLYKIALNNNTSVDELMMLNNLSSNLLNVGQKILLPTSSNDENTYTVQNGDTLYKIANKFNTSVDNIKELNNLNSNILTIGQIIKTPATTNNNYIVQSGDTLYSIAKKFNKDIQDIKRINNLTDDILSIGQILKI